MTGRSTEFVEFATSHAANLRRTAYVLCRDWHLAEDLTQIALAKLYVAWPRLDWSHPPEAYVRRILYNTFLSQRRRMWRREVSTPTPPDLGVESPMELRMTMLDALSRLPPRDRAIVLLRYWEDQSVETVAATLNLTTGVVRTQSMRSLAKLREWLGEDTAVLFH
jgi:RNA polymerase sigma-70 factor (sigma-E family)